LFVYLPALVCYYSGITEHQPKLSNDSQGNNINDKHYSLLTCRNRLYFSSKRLYTHYSII